MNGATCGIATEVAGPVATPDHWNAGGQSYGIYPNASFFCPSSADLFVLDDGLPRPLPFATVGFGVVTALDSGIGLGGGLTGLGSCF